MLSIAHKARVLPRFLVLVFLSTTPSGQMRTLRTVSAADWKITTTLPVKPLSSLFHTACRLSLARVWFSYANASCKFPPSRMSTGTPSRTLRFNQSTFETPLQKKWNYQLRGLMELSPPEAPPNTQHALQVWKSFLLRYQPWSVRLARWYCLINPFPVFIGGAIFFRTMRDFELIAMPTVCNVVACDPHPQPDANRSASRGPFVPSIALRFYRNHLSGRISAIMITDPNHD